MGRKRPVLVSYDITMDKTRRHVFKILKDWRLDGQKSVHECRLTSTEAAELFIQLEENLNPKTDLLMMVWLDQHREIICRGTGRNTVREELLHIT